MYLLLCIWIQDNYPRSIYRPADPLMPEISARWVGDTTSYTLEKYHLEEYPLFQLFDKDYFQRASIPNKPITYRIRFYQTVNKGTFNLI